MLTNSLTPIKQEPIAIDCTQYVLEGRKDNFYSIWHCAPIEIRYLPALLFAIHILSMYIYCSYTLIDTQGMSVCGSMDSKWKINKLCSTEQVCTVYHIVSLGTTREQRSFSQSDRQQQPHILIFHCS